VITTNNSKEFTDYRNEKIIMLVYIIVSYEKETMI